MLERFRALRRLLVELSGLFFGLLIIVAGDLTALLFGERYQRSAAVIRVLSVFSALVFITYPYTMLAEALNKLRARLVCRIYHGIAMIILVLVLSRFFGVYGAAAGVALGQATHLVLLHCVTREHNGGTTALASDCRSLISVAVAGLAAGGVKSILPGGGAAVLMVPVVYAAVFLGFGVRFSLLKEMHRMATSLWSVRATRA